MTYLDKIEDGMFGQISAFEQMKGAAPLYWVRGNHDVVNYTGRKPGITADRKALEQWDVCTLMTKFRGSDAMTDNENRESAYYYYDSKVAKIRYLVFDTTDSVRDNNMVTGVSSPQLRFLADAGLKVPQGWKIVYISHIPIFDKYAKKHQASMEGAMSLVEAMEKHLPFKVGDEMYDFSKRPDIELICGLCGHRHRDYFTETPGGAIQLNFDSDCNYVRKDVAGSLCEQSFNYVSIAKDGHTIRVIRLGNGENRTYSR